MFTWEKIFFIFKQPSLVGIPTRRPLINMMVRNSAEEDVSGAFQWQSVRVFSMIFLGSSNAVRNLRNDFVCQ
jgi:hypothetical protein